MNVNSKPLNLSNRSDSPKHSQSKFLKEFEALSKAEKEGLDLDYLKGHFLEASQDQSGSRFIQEKLNKGTMEDKVLVYGELKADLIVLMKDVFSNYIIQQLIQVKGEDHEAIRSDITKRIKSHILQLSINKFSCRVI